MMSNLFYYTKFGDGLYFITEINNEGAKTFTFIEDKGYKRLLDGMINKYESIELWESRIIKNDTVVYDYNTKKGIESCLRLQKRGITNIIGGTPFQYALEHDRAFALKLLASNGVLIPDTFVMPNNAEGIKFVKANEDRYVYKPDGEDTGSAETYLAENGKDMIDFIQARPDQKFILQKFVPDGVCEIGIECYFSKGDLVKGISHTIETKKFMPGNLGPNTGCMSSVSWFSAEEEEGKLFKLTWEKILHVFKEEGYTGACDISGIITKKGDFYVLEITPRFGYSQDINLYRLLKMNISELWTALANGSLKEIKRDLTKFAGCGRYTIPPYPLEQKKGFEKQVTDLLADTINTPVVFKEHKDCKIFWIDLKKSRKGELITAGIDAIIAEVATTGMDLLKMQDVIISQMKDIKLGDGQYRIDMFEDAYKQIPIIADMDYFDNNYLMPAKAS